MKKNSDADERRSLAHRRSEDLSSYHFAALVEAADAGIISEDLDGIVTSWNPAAEAIFGYRAAEMIGRSILVLIPQDLAWEEDVFLSRIREGERVRHYKTRRVTKSGNEITISLKLSPIYGGDGSVIGASKIIRDISSEEEHERTLIRAKNQFIANISHELRTPLTAIRAAVKLLRISDATLDATLRARLTRIADDNASRMLRLVDEILNYEKLNAESALEIQPCSLSQLLLPVMEAIWPVAEEKAVKLVSSLDATQADLVMDADPYRLQQALLNLVANAIKYSPAEATVEVMAVTEPGFVTVSVCDEGRGIPGVLLEKIFEPFEQVEKIDARREGGVGLGLAISRTIVEQHGGTIWAEQNDSKKRGACGSTFSFRIPLRQTLVRSA